MSILKKLFSSSKPKSSNEHEIETGYKITNSDRISMQNPTVIGNIKTGFHIENTKNSTINGAIVSSNERGAIFLRTVQALSSSDIPEATHIKELICKLYSLDDEKQKEITYKEIISYASDHMTILAPFLPLIYEAAEKLLG
ncbi:hypothetical protein [Enterobacter asburiae]|uniref:hypothetical protein n=1 Tax=Enterobacter asburiae TaxID=61645 RepID=UPI002FD5E771